jgi:hypothetical protein
MSTRALKSQEAAFVNVVRHTSVAHQLQSMNLTMTEKRGRVGKREKETGRDSEEKEI